MGKRKVLILLGGAILLVVTWSLYSLKHGRIQPKLNLLLITLDTTRADRLGLYGYDKPTSPNLDALAGESTVFDFAIAQAAVTPVSHASILTGLDPYHHGLRVMHGLTDNRLGKEQVTLAEVWKRVGAQTAAFVSAFPVTATFGLDQGFEVFDENFPSSDGKGLVSGSGIVNAGKSQRRADEVTKAAIAWLRNKADRDRPLFMWVHYFDPHDPLLLPPKEELQRLLVNEFQPASEKQEDRLRAIYDCEVYYMDVYIGKLLNEFKKLGLWEKTLIVAVADHGEGLGDHNWWTHGILYQEQIRVPLIVHVPAIKGGKRIKSLVRTIDIVPTVLEAAGIAPEDRPDMDGTSLIEAIHKGKTKEARYAYSDSINMLTYSSPGLSDRRDIKDDKLYCLVQDGYKMIYHQLRPEESELYNLSEDP